MIQITKEQALAVREKFGDQVRITITNRQKSGDRKRYYVEETPRIMYFLDKIQKKI